MTTDVYVNDLFVFLAAVLVFAMVTFLPPMSFHE